MSAKIRRLPRACTIKDLGSRLGSIWDNFGAKAGSSLLNMWIHLESIWNDLSFKTALNAVDFFVRNTAQDAVDILVLFSVDVVSVGLSKNFVSCQKC